MPKFPLWVRVWIVFGILVVVMIILGIVGHSL